jgi:hypothetical protein
MISISLPLALSLIAVAFVLGVGFASIYLSRRA